MASKEKLSKWWNHGINPITGWIENKVYTNSYNPKVYNIPTRNKNKYSN